MGYVAEFAVWAPDSYEHAQAIRNELLTKVATSVSVASPIWYRPLRNNAAGGVGIGAATVNGSPDFFSEDHPTLSSDSTASISLWPDPASVQVGKTEEITIVRDQEAPAGAGVTYNLVSGSPSVATVPSDVNMPGGETEIPFDVDGVSPGSSTITVTNAADSNETQSVTVNVVTTRKLKLLAHVDALGATGVKGSVHAQPIGGALLGEHIGDFSGASFGAITEGGLAPLTVDVVEFNGSVLSTSDTPVCVWEGTSAAGSALGNAQPIGSVGPHECTVVED